MSTNFDASWADSARQFQQMVGEGWSQMLQVLQPKEMGAALSMPAAGPVSFAPDKLAAVQQRYLQEVQALWSHALHHDEAPLSNDRRFAGENWAHNPLSAFSVAAYQLQAHALMGLVDAVQADDKTRARIRFSVEQWLAAMAPSNFLVFNADA
ncbi:MAG: class I poly(R)-hydroxyalkanoic acid synthase, partial [Acidovorax sp.]|nr:class I poly(R)-hydroxyalkanoic acid synthase [Acidovorax sp.]